MKANKIKSLLLVNIVLFSLLFLCTTAYADFSHSDVQGYVAKPSYNDKEASSSGKKSTTSLETELEKLKKESQKIKNDLEGLSDEKKAEKENLDKIVTQIANLQDQIIIVQQQIDQLDIEIKGLDDEIDGKQILIENLLLELEEKEEEYRENFELFKKRVRVMFMTNDESTLGMLLGAESMADFLKRNEIFGRIAESDKNTIETLIGIRNQIESDKQLIEDEKLILENNKIQIESKKLQAESKRSELDNTKKELDVLSKESEGHIIAIGNREQTMRMSYEETQEKMEDIDAEIKRIIAENASAAASEYVGGKFQWPVPGFFTISCGYMGYPGHSGMDITGRYSGAISGAEIKSAGGGTVIAVVRGNTGYGHYVIVDHGGGYTTLYAHASSLVAYKGQQVKAGTTLGYVGSTGNSTGPHLHFEVRINGKHTNPEPYLK